MYKIYKMADLFLVWISPTPFQTQTLGTAPITFIHFVKRGAMGVEMITRSHFLLCEKR